MSRQINSYHPSGAEPSEGAQTKQPNRRELRNLIDTYLIKGKPDDVKRKKPNVDQKRPMVTKFELILLPGKKNKMKITTLVPKGTDNDSSDPPPADVQYQYQYQCFLAEESDIKSVIARVL